MTKIYLYTYYVYYFGKYLKQLRILREKLVVLVKKSCEIPILQPEKELFNDKLTNCFKKN